VTTLAHLASNQFIISRLQTTSGYLMDFSTVTGCKGNLQPTSPSKTQLFDGVVGKTFTIYVDGTIDVEEEDKFRDIDTGAVYKVMTGGVSRRTMGAIDYSEVVVQLVN